MQMTAAFCFDVPGMLSPGSTLDPVSRGEIGSLLSQNGCLTSVFLLSLVIGSKEFDADSRFNHFLISENASVLSHWKLLMCIRSLGF